MITLEDALRIIAAAERKANEIKQPMNIAVAVAGGNLGTHVRQETSQNIGAGMRITACRASASWKLY